MYGLAYVCYSSGGGVLPQEALPAEGDKGVDHCEDPLFSVLWVTYADGVAGNIKDWQINASGVFDNTLGTLIALGTLKNIVPIKMNDGRISISAIDATTIKHYFYDAFTGLIEAMNIAAGQMVDHCEDKIGNTSRLVFMIWDTSAFYVVVATLDENGDFATVSAKVNMALASPKKARFSIEKLRDGSFSAVYVDTSNIIKRYRCEDLDNDATGTWVAT